MRSPPPKGLKLTLYPICGLGLTSIVLITRTLVLASPLGWGVGRAFGFVHVWCFWLPFVHDLCTPGDFFYLYNICFLLIKKNNLPIKNICSVFLLLASMKFKIFFDRKKKSS